MIQPDAAAADRGVAAALPRVAYVVNQYPKVSHTFIRSEIAALELQGVAVRRFGLRGWDGELADERDRQEQQKTVYVLRQGLRGLASAVIGHFFTSPRRTLHALRTSVQLSRRADRSLPYHIAYWAEACFIARALDRAPVDHIHAHFGTNAAEVALLVHRLTGLPFSFTVHGPEEFDKPQALKLADKMAAAAFVVAISSYGRSQLWRWMAHRDWHKVKVVHCAVDPGFYTHVPSAVGSASRLVCVGRLCEQKGQLLLCQAAAELVRQGVALELVLAGDGEMRAAIEASIVELGLQEHVRVTGWVDAARVREELLAARALVLPSFAEGLPVVLMEALAMQRPVISTSVAGISELVRQGKEGWLIPAGDLPALVEAMRACILARTGELDAMGVQGRQRVLDRHNDAREAKRLATLFASGGAHGDER